MATLKSPRWNNNNNLWSAESNYFNYGSGDADGYENIVWNRIIDPLHSIIADEFQVPVYFDEHKGNQSFMILPTEDNLVGLLSGNAGQEREHTIEITYQLKSGGQYGESSFKKNILTITDATLNTPTIISFCINFIINITKNIIII